MRQTIILLLFFSVTSFAQFNPDGRGMSLHLTAYSDIGSLDQSANTFSRNFATTSFNSEIIFGENYFMELMAKISNISKSYSCSICLIG
jgi:hypothetical protein